MAGDLPPVVLPGGRTVPEHLLVERATPHGGPGGQHANRSSTRVELRVLVAGLPLTQAERGRVFTRLGGRIAADGTVGVSVGTSRHQMRNRQEARRRLGQLLADAMAEEQQRIPTTKSRGVLRRMRESRERTAARRRSRRWRPEDEPE